MGTGYLGVMSYTALSYAGDVLLATTTRTGAPGFDLPVGVLVVLGIIAFVVVAVVWMVTGSSGG